jgi:hypothetical protein
MEKRPEVRMVWVVIFLLLLITRIPMMSNYFSIDNVNLAFALEKFDPRIHQPQPPGYPLFVFFARLVNLLFHDAFRAFAAISVLVSALSLWLAFLLGRRMFSVWAGVVGACLLLVNPVFWLAGIEGPLRPNLALFSLLVAYCCWRCWNGEKRFAMWGAIALGIGSGFRPDLLAFLLPLWLISSFIGTRSWRTVLSAAGALVAIVTVWTSATIIAMGGFRAFYTVMFDYAVDWSRVSSAAPGSSVMGWLRQKNRLFIWNGLAIIGWIWATPFYFFKRDKLPLGRIRLAFLALCILPGVILQLLTHYDNPGHLLFSIVAFCLVGGYVLSLAPLREILAEAVLIINAAMFLNYFGLPKVTTPTDGPSLINAMRVGMYESSVGWIRHMDSITRDTLAEVDKYTPPGGSCVIITTDGFVDKWFMNWRIGRYYLPKYDFWVLYQTPGKKRVEQIVRDKRLGFRFSPLTMPIFRKGRIMWILEPDGSFLKELAKSVPLQGGKYVSYLDITPDSPSIVVDGFEIVPSIPVNK